MRPIPESVRLKLSTSSNRHKTNKVHAQTRLCAGTRATSQVLNEVGNRRYVAFWSRELAPKVDTDALEQRSIFALIWMEHELSATHMDVPSRVS